ncbi:MAG: hypothetical protein ACYDEV_15085 [Acidiferrobacter sp.]
MVDTQKLFKTLCATGLPEPQAEAYTRLMWVVASQAREDIPTLEAVLQEKITQLKVSGYTEVQVQIIDEAVRRVIQIKRNAHPALVGCVMRETGP